MINGEKWLNNMILCSLEIIPCLNYNHNTRYVLPIPPSPNLPNMRSVYLYPSLCFFEGTNISIGRGSNFPFQVFGAPYFKKKEFSFTPMATFGSKNPKYKSVTCYGSDLRNISLDTLKNTKKLNLNWLVNSYKISNESADFFKKNNFFNLLSGSDKLMNLVKGGANPKHIYETYQKELNEFKTLRKHYLMYDDFE